MTKVLITGANRGVGFGLVRQYVADGAEVIACCRNPANADALGDLASSFEGRIRVMRLDVGDEASISSLKESLGDEPIDVLISNAGINGTPKDQSATRIDPENWINTVRVNALGPMLLAQALAENLRCGSKKKLVAISSVFGSNAKDYGAGVATATNRYAYRASKAALNNGMRGLARDWAKDGIIVGILDPGWVRTDMAGEAAVASPTSISADESASGIKGRIDLLGPESSGIFQRFWGEPIPW
ncbi:SDR family oxidoreductase [Bradyrhizobium diazoefficiens]|uniref:SDR family oxidoreductase n=1 Tax=Bradyrhizobium diazoefficiens TaxID=1355477 RepID=UPI00190B6839|nr:SDR family oxidoreductase [Bradyrhizobium diazoefficiens]QQO35580.1 SDR family oxidoreductase [Bradyrhizobium diazoefficiens]